MCHNPYNGKVEKCICGLPAPKSTTRSTHPRWVCYEVSLFPNRSGLISSAPALGFGESVSHTCTDVLMF